MGEDIVSEIMREYLQQLAAKGTRVDGRKLDEYRQIEIKKNVISSAEGSAQVSIGNTSVLVGVKVELGEPFPDTPNVGVLTTNAELIPLASPTFEAGPPNEEGIELARVVDRGLREGRVIDLEKLCVAPGEKVWIIFVDIHVLDYDGNLFDAAYLASLAALTCTRVPASAQGMGEDFPLPLNGLPIECTVVKIKNAMMVDPALDEEKIADVRLTMAIDENGNIRAVQKGLAGSFSVEEVRKVISMCQVCSSKLREILKSS
ncbi:MAG: exosome complex protein Rrp42 [Thermoplasmata archaeon]|nr:exosome complex protein Rrp42 [Thermoplasmata archaeon]